LKKKILIVFAVLIFILVVSCAGIIIFYNTSLKAPTTAKEEAGEVVTIIVNQGETSKHVIDTLYNSGLIRNKYVGYAYLKLNNDFILQAGVYDIEKGLDLPEILEYIGNGKVVDNSISVTFIEGRRLTSYVKTISENFNVSEDDVMAKLNDKEYLKTLTEKYWFLTDEILNDKLYYALEGYLYPNTYRFNKDASIEDVIEKLLDATGTILTNYKTQIESSEYTVHEILTMASIVELEGAGSDDRQGVSGVFYNRLNNGWSLGSDVTTYYGARVNMSDRDLYQKEIDEVNDYNTRPAAMAGKLPIGPICSPGSDSIEATLNPKHHDYFYFVADKNKVTYFSKTYEEHNNTINKLKSEGLWFTY